MYIYIYIYMSLSTRLREAPRGEWQRQQGASEPPKQPKGRRPPDA